MGDSFYKLARTVGRPWAFELRGSQNLQPGLPGIFVGNHLAGNGPIQAILTIPVRLYPWVIAEMADKTRARAYLYDDYVAPVWHLRGKLGMAVSGIVSRIAVALIHALGCVPVDRTFHHYLDTFRKSLTLLVQGSSLLILPEDRTQEIDAATKLYPFMFGFLYLCRQYHRVTGSDLPLYPFAVVPETHQVIIGPAHYLLPSAHSRKEIIQMRDELQAAVAELYVSVNQAPGIQAGVF
ncbi:MAG: hypothetical protein ACYC6L_17330 [Anaerolineae bacterium]